MTAVKRPIIIKYMMVRIKLKNPFEMVALRLALTPDVCSANTALMQSTFQAPLLAKITFWQTILVVLTTVYTASIVNFVRNNA